MGMFDISAGDGVEINTGSVSTSGDDILEYGKDLQTLLDNFESEIQILTKSGMQGFFSDQLGDAYNKVRDSLTDYATRIQKVGTAVRTSAEEMENASTTAGNSISGM